MRISELSLAMGVLVEDFDPDRATDSDWTRLRQALYESDHLLLLRGRPYSDAEHRQIAAAFGPIGAEIGTGNDVRYVSNTRPDGSLGSIAASWHIDFGFFPRPYEALSLYGVEIPQAGTVTRFANAVAAAADLPPEMKARLDGLQARQVADVASPEGEAGVRIRIGRLDETYPHHVRPVLWQHWRSGEPILGVWEQQTDAILPLEPEESSVLILELFDHLYQPQYIYTHQWQVDDLVIWDNHAVQHSRPDVGTEHARTLRRVPIGEPQDYSLFAHYAQLRAERQALT
ncbi:MAG TPA: TauD/TfdA family dioxygenase [Jatrophihabitans sp.]|jgi:taurine dioxygenase